MQRSWKKLQKIYSEDYGIGSTTEQRKRHKRKLKHKLKKRIDNYYKKFYNY